MTQEPLFGERLDYSRSSLDIAEVDPNPIQQFLRWYEDAKEAGIPEPNAMALSTVSEQGRPSSRMVLLRGVDASGFAFYTNYLSRKGLELCRNPWASLLFFWQPLERQVRIEGPARQVPEVESDAYFASRPLESRLGAWASPQSEVVADREALERLLRDVRSRFGGSEAPRPPHWGGYRLIPEYFEFWQGRTSRLHDRLRYRRNESAVWEIQRLAP